MSGACHDAQKRKGAANKPSIGGRHRGHGFAASEKQSRVDVEAKAQELLDEHPEADATHSDIADTLRDESKDAGFEEGAASLGEVRAPAAASAATQIMGSRWQFLV